MIVSHHFLNIVLWGGSSPRFEIISFKLDSKLGDFESWGFIYQVLSF